MAFCSSFLVVCCCWELLFSVSSIVASHDLDVDFRPLFYFTEKPNRTVYGPPNGTVCLNCSAFCAKNGSVSITWYKDNRLITTEMWKYTLTNNSLCVKRLRRSSLKGSYECLAQHDIGVIVSPKVKLEVARMSSSIYVDPLNTSAVEGGSIRFRCHVNAIPWPTIEWERNGQKVSDDDVRVTILNGEGILQLIDMRKEDEGEYICIAKTSWTNQTSLPALLTVMPSNSSTHQVAAVLLGRPRDQIVILSQTVVLECFLAGHPTPVIRWTKQGNDLREDARQFGNGNLEISNVKESDAGIYICDWKSLDDGKTRKAQANITVYVPPHLLVNKSMKPYTLKRREQVIRLTCQFSGRPAPQITWFKNGQRLEQTNRIKIDRFELSILQTKASDAGMYQCRAENEAGVQQTATLLQFESNENSPFPPVGLVAVTVNSTSIRLSWKDSPLNRGRDVTAYSIHIKPAKDEQELQEVVPRQWKQLGGSLVVETLRPYTNYSIYVVAYNIHGGSEHSRKIIVLTAEDVPINFPLLRLVSHDTGSLQLNWEELSPDQARGVVTEYKIMYQRHGSQQYEQFSIRPVKTEYIITGLKPNTKYDVMISARTKAGYPPLPPVESLPWVTGMTKGLNQSGVPSTPEMTAIAVDNAAILVNWMMRNQSVQILGYRLSCQLSGLVSDDGKSDHLATLKADVNSHLFSNLVSASVYQLHLVAFNSKGESQATVQTVRTKSLSAGDSMHPSPSIFAIETTAINSSAILLSWKKPMQTFVADYIVSYRASSNSASSVSSNSTVYILLKSLKEKLIVGNLLPFTFYEFSVEARGNQAVTSETAKCQTAEGVPSAPLDLDATFVGFGSVHLQWNPPIWRNGIIVKYTVLYAVDRAWPSAQWLTKVENGTSLSTLIQALKLSSTYYFQVQAATNAGRGPPSDIVQVNTGPAAAGALTDQDLGIIIGTSIGVTCIIICTCIIVLHNRCRRMASVPTALAEGHVANGTVTSCRCHPAHCTAEFHVLRPRADVSIPCDNHLLIENSNCDTKGGNLQNGRNSKYSAKKIDIQSVDESGTQSGKSKENSSQVVPLLGDNLDLDRIDYEDDFEVTMENTTCSDYMITSDGMVIQNDILNVDYLPSQICSFPGNSFVSDEKIVTSKEDKVKENAISEKEPEDDVSRPNNRRMDEKSCLPENQCMQHNVIDCSECKCSIQKKTKSSHSDCQELSCDSDIFHPTDNSNLDNEKCIFRSREKTNPDPADHRDDCKSQDCCCNTECAVHSRIDRANSIGISNSGFPPLKQELVEISLCSRQSSPSSESVEAVELADSGVDDALNQEIEITTT